MGKIKQGILGGFRGKVGNVIGGNWKGIDYMRVKPASVANPKTVGQVGQRNKFSAVLHFLQPMKNSGPVPATGINNRLAVFRQYTWNIFKQTTTGDM